MIKKYVLYIEDEAFQAKLFSKIIGDEIEEFGYKILTLSNGSDAIKFLEGKKVLKVEKNEVGLILLDLAMHDISGFQILKEIAKDKVKIPVAVLSAREDDDIKKEAKKLGAIDYFIKGKDLAELQRLRKFVTKTMGK